MTTFGRNPRIPILHTAASVLRRSSRYALASLLACAFFAGGGCGSDENGGSGTLCTPGDTKACLGAGQCQGAQACADDGQSFLPCDCGGGGGSGGSAGASAGGSSGAGTGGTAGGAGASGFAGAVADGSAGSGGLDGGTDGAPPDAPFDASPPGPLDDPCPTPPMKMINCSQSCAAVDPKCAQGECPTLGTQYYYYITDPAEFGTCANGVPCLNIRMPANPYTISKCQCTDGTAYGLIIGFKLTDKIKALRATVEPPWKVWMGPNSQWTQCKHSQSAQCAVQNSADNNILIITTDDATAPSRNVLIEGAPYSPMLPCST